MKLFIAEKKEKGYISATDYHWCDSGDILMFPQFSTGNGNPSEVYMVGIKSRAATTHILIKDMDVSVEFLKELLIESVERSMKTNIQNNGDFDICLDNGWDMNFNINEMVDELLLKASQFNDGDKVVINGRTPTKITHVAKN